MGWGFLVYFAITFLISAAMSYILRPKQRFGPPPTPSSLDQFKVPTAEVGRVFPVLFGYRPIEGYNVVWYGNLSIVPIVERVKVSSGGLFGGSKHKRITVGYRYYLGMHVVLAHNIQSIKAVTVDDKLLWTGNATDSLYINQPNIFGGDQQGGGLQGQIDILCGGPTQMPNDYLQYCLGTDIPAFRNVASLVFRGFYFGTSTYIKSLSFWTQNIYNSWYPEKANIGNDMNPAHIIHETIVNRTWGMGYNVADIDDAFFRTAADKLHDEGFGLSFVWDYQSKIEDFLTEVLDHIDAVLYTDVTTGKWKLKLIRDDYEVDNLLVFDESNIIKVESYKRRTLEDIPNQVTIKYFDIETGQTGSITRADIAMVARMGTNAATIEYPGITSKTLAEVVLARELRALSNPLSNSTLVVNRDGMKLSPGDPFILSYSRYGIEQVIMRATAIEYGKFGEGQIRIECIEDIFGIAEASYAPPPPSGWVSPVNDPAPCPVHVPMEAPYHVVANEAGQLETDNLATNVGFAAIAGVRPTNDAFDADVYTKLSTASEYELKDTIYFAPYGLLASDISLTDTTISVVWQRDFSLVKAGDWGIIDNEIVEIKSIVNENTITIGRGCFDTTPVSHAVNANIIILPYFLAIDGTKYVSGNTVHLKMCPSTGKGVLPLTSAPQQAVTMNSRLIRPYPPARLRLNNLANPTELFGNISMAWKHRNRKLQLDIIYDTEDDVDIGPEIGTTYSYEVKNAGGNLLTSGSGISGNSGTILSSAINYDGNVNLSLWSIRDGFASWQKQARAFYYLRAEPRCLEENVAEIRITEEGDERILEV